MQAFYTDGFLWVTTLLFSPEIVAMRCTIPALQKTKTISLFCIYPAKIRHLIATSLTLAFLASTAYEISRFRSVIRNERKVAASSSDHVSTYLYASTKNSAQAHGYSG